MFDKLIDNVLDEASLHVDCKLLLMSDGIGCEPQPGTKRSHYLLFLRVGEDTGPCFRNSSQHGTHGSITSECVPSLEEL